MSIRRLIIFDAFNTLVTARQDSAGTFLTGLAQAGLEATVTMLTQLQAASEGFDHSAWSGSRKAYVGWARQTLRRAGRVGINAELAPCIVPALEQLHQAPMVAMPGAAACLRKLRAAGFAIAVCSNWGWDLPDDLHDTGLVANIDVLVTSAQIGVRKPHQRIYMSTLERAGFAAEEAVFVGDSLRTDVLGPRSAGIGSMLLAPVAMEAFSGQQARSLAAVSDLLIDGADVVRAAERIAPGSHIASLPSSPADPADRPEHLSITSRGRATRSIACAPLWAVMCPGPLTGRRHEDRQQSGQGNAGPAAR